MDKNQVEKDKITVELAGVMNEHGELMAQLAVDQAEAASPDRLNHWRGALGWVCDIAIAWNLIDVRNPGKTR